MGLCVKHIVSLLAVSLFSGLHADAQEYQFTHFTVEDGLPSPETYFVHEDVFGYIWIGTDRGLSRYDGYEFTNFTTGNSDLTNNTVFKCYEAPNHDLWFTCYDGSISIYRVASRGFEPFEFNDSLQTWFSYWPKHIVFNSTSILVYGYNENYFMAEFKNESITKVHNVQLFEKFSCFEIVADGEHFKVFTSTPPAVYSSKVEFLYPENNQPLRHLNSGVINDTLWFWDRSKLYMKVGVTTRVFEIGSPINHVSVGPNVLIMAQSGVYQLSVGSVQWLSALPLNASYCEGDREKGFWVSTLNNGLFRFYSPEPLGNAGSFIRHHHSVIALNATENYMLAGTKGEELLMSNGLGFDTIFTKFTDNQRNHQMSQMVSCGDRIVTNGGFIISEIDGKLRFDRLAQNSISVLNYFLSEDRIFTTTYKPGFEITNLSGEVLYTNNLAGSRVTTLCTIGSTILVGSQKGVTTFDFGPGDTILTTKTNSLTQYAVTDIANVDQRLIYGTMAHGLVIEQSNRRRKLTSNEGLISDVVNCVKFENDSILWVGTNKGLSKVLVADDLRRSRVLYSLNTDDGLISDFIYAIEFWRDQIWIGTDKGLFSLPLSYSPKQVAPRLNIEKLIIDNTLYSPTKKSYRWQQQEVLIKYVGISFNKPEKGFYRYRLHRVGEERSPYHYTNNTLASFNNLTKGKYVFEINCKNKNNVWSETHSYTFRVSPHWTQSALMYILLCLLGLWFTLFLLRWRSKVIKRQTLQSSYLRELEMKFAESELALLRNQMNPHFVFNALNSIQSFVLERDIQMASDYISRFSKLMRSSLNYSRKDFIPLNHELTFLESYLKIEKSRFPSRFDFAVTCTENVEVEDMEIPPLLLQPVVENSVKHAFNSDTVGGNISVLFDQNEEFLICVIQDNGLGIVQTKNKEHTSHVSIGLDVLQSRLSLIYNEGDEPEISIDNLKNIGEGTGTRVTIKLPIA